MERKSIMVVKAASLFILILLTKIIDIEGKSYYQNTYQVVTERALLKYCNQRLISGAKVFSFKFNRTLIAFNIVGTIKYRFDTVTLHVQFYKFLSNEYRYFPITLNDLDGCKALIENSYGLRDMLHKSGNLTFCPFEKGYYEIRNIVPNATALPPNIPEGRYMLTVNLSVPNYGKVGSIEYYVAVKYGPKIIH